VLAAWLQGPAFPSITLCDVSFPECQPILVGSAVIDSPVRLGEPSCQLLKPQLAINRYVKMLFFGPHKTSGCPQISLWLQI
jgi:hypothetical protein